MAYSTSPETVRNMQASLRLLEEGKPCSWRMPRQEASKFAYKVREALYAAAQNRMAFPALAEAYQKFEIRLTHDGVQAVPKRLPQIEEVEPQAAAAAPAPAPAPVFAQVLEPLLEALPAPVSIPGDHSKFSVIEYCGKRPGKTVVFPDARLDEAALTAVYRWAKLQQPELMLMAEVGIDGLTVSAVDPEVEEYQWRPSGE